MDFGLNFFPSVGPAEKSAETYFAESLELCAAADRMGYGHIRTVEHYFEAYGGYSPNPVLFLTAAAQRTEKIRLVTGAVLPIFNHPLKLAGELAELDAISKGRLEVGFARAFLPHEFERFGRALDESRARFDEGVHQVIRLLAEENVTEQGRFHSFRNTTSLPRPVQRPTPPIWQAAFSTEQSFEDAGRKGWWLMGIPLAGERMRDLIAIYRDAWRSAGHPGDGRVMLSFAMFCAPTRAAAEKHGAPCLDGYLKALVAGAGAWTEGADTRDYPGYDKMIAGLKRETYQTQRDKGVAWVGTPDEIAEMIADYQALVGGFDSASMQVNFHAMPGEAALQSLELFADAVMPRFS
jgi:alkanesulfonate monooxygenase SsuD/methylene tetrahydromethanopterin reductase-like flavin-dependent oxidoreductase (luciferase family)